ADDPLSSAEGCGLGTLAELNAAVEAVVELEKRIAALHGARAAALVHAERLTRHVDLSAPDARKNRRHDPAVTERAFIAELATALHKPERTAERLIAKVAGSFSTSCRDSAM
ncbi:hypothetical protein ACC691_37400, partial [Rhizobium johnstonii]|uniref:hypothetical protein n=1 Tax=Rhizobium johnstonii TaxID=3019933 RepID=UPI003F962122